MLSSVVRIFHDFYIYIYIVLIFFVCFLCTYCRWRKSEDDVSATSHVPIILNGKPTQRLGQTTIAKRQSAQQRGRFTSSVIHMFVSVCVRQPMFNEYYYGTISMDFFECNSDPLFNKLDFYWPFSMQTRRSNISIECNQMISKINSSVYGKCLMPIVHVHWTHGHAHTFNHTTYISHTHARRTHTDTSPNKTIGRKKTHINVYRL